jgi:hypothetical protein
MKITNVKAMVAKGITAGLLAGAMVFAAPAKANAQRVVVGVQVGYPHYYDHARFEPRHDVWFYRHDRNYRYYGRRW